VQPDRNGAVLSALARSNEQIMPLLVVAVMAQLVFSGGMIPVTGRLLLDLMSWATLARWGFAASASTVDLPSLVPGQLSPRDSHWMHTSSAWLFDFAMLAVLGIVFAGFVRWKIRLGRGAIGRRFRRRAALSVLSPAHKGPSDLHLPATVSPITSLHTVATHHMLHCDRGAQMNLADLPEMRALTNPDLPAIADDNVSLNNCEFAGAVCRASAALHQAGVSRGDVVAVMLPNTTALVVALFAAWRLGAAVTPINPSLRPTEVGYQLSDADAKVLVVDATPELDTGPLSVLTAAELTSAAATGPLPAADPADDTLALLIYTSGTTGRPKGVMLDHGNLIAMCRGVIDAVTLTGADHCLLILPLFHVNGIVISTLAPLLVGGRTTIAGRFSPKTFFDRIERSGATYFSAVPTIYTMLSGLPAEVKPDATSVRFAICGAAPASVELLEQFETRYRIPIVEGYGLSEGTCASTLNPPAGQRKAGTVGLPLPGQNIRLIDANGMPVPAGEAGEVVIKGPNVMRGYLNRPEETAKTVVDGWLHTGDVGRFDEDGYLVLVDRAKDMIIRGGENIYPREIEAVVHGLPEIAEAAVVGRPNPVYGEEPVLFVSLQPGKQLDVDAIREHLADSLSKYKLPVDITILDDLPKNAVGKIAKPDLRQRLTATH
jgi:long-chain acyl-CoA synthetase